MKCGFTVVIEREKMEMQLGEVEIAAHLIQIVIPLPKSSPLGKV